MPAKAPVLPLLKVTLPAFPPCAMFNTPPLKLEPRPSTVTVPFPLKVAMLICAAPLETVPPAATLKVLLPSEMKLVVESVEPAPVTTIVEAVEFV
jgi:hypothetical protein